MTQFTIHGYTSATLDFDRPTALTKAYVVASSFRSGSNHLCLALWETGVLGAPWEYFNYDTEKRFMYSRLGVQSPGDYLRKLLACRTSRNGVFGVKAHFRHFEVALREYPPMLEVLRDAKFVYINRRDKVAQAVSLARALQTGAWFAFSKSDRFPLFYSREFIDECLEEVRKQALSWILWFRERNQSPVTVHYESLLADPAATVASVADFIGVKLDAAARLQIPRLAKQSDEINQEWCERYRRDHNLPPAAQHSFAWDVIPFDHGVAA
jgi:trehalose 2-sulfotransferase